MIGLDK